MHAFTHFLSRTRTKLKSWHLSGVNDLKANLINTENYINYLELSDLNDNSQNILLDHYAKLSTMQCQCNIKWAQRAKLLWIKDGDRNTHFCIPSLAFARTITIFLKSMF